jgi:signal transduction histidine kinase
MTKPEIPQNEIERLNSLNSYSILDTLPEKEYDEITLLASQICQTPISLISLIDEKRQWFKSHYGLHSTETPREISFCGHAINTPGEIFIVSDSRSDARFSDNPLVTNDPYVIFYAGIPLVNDAGYPLGTLCVIDNKPNILGKNQIEALKALSNQLIQLFELRKKTIDLEIKIMELKAQNKGLEKFAHIAAHDIKSPLSNIVMLADFLESKLANCIDNESLELFQHIKKSSENLIQLINGILTYSKSTSLLSANKENSNLTEIVHDTVAMVDSSKQVKFETDIPDCIILYSSKTAIQQIILNLLANAIKYNDKAFTTIKITAKDTGEFVKISVTDNGPGIKEEDKHRIFKIFETAACSDKYGEKGNGIGLATVKLLVEGLGGNISVTSEIGQWTEFEFTIKK